MILKYRCWDKTKQEWRQPDPNHRVSMLLASDRDSMRIVAPSEYILVIYTGFSDKHGVDIYRGDVLDDKYSIDWDILNGRWIARTRDGKICDFSKYRPHDHEITGTIFEEDGWVQLED